MKLSVIVPVYNVEDYLKACIESVINQTYKNLEIILIDDGSTDNSSSICDYYADEYNNITVIHQENKGVSAARNRGLDIASGELVSFLDSDDTIDEDMYEILISKFINSEIDIVHCSYKRIEDGRETIIGNTGSVFNQDTNMALEYLLSGKMFNASLCNKIFRKNLFKNIRLNQDLRINEDVLFCYQLFSRSKLSVFIDIAKYNYLVRKNASATNSTDNLIKSFDVVYVCEYMYENSEDNLKWIALNRLINAYFMQYRSLKENSSSKNELELTKQKICRLLVNRKHLNKKNRVSAYLLIRVPCVYTFFYYLYSKVRKPNWDVN